MHKAIAIIQFKLEKEIIDRNPSFNMEHRLLLYKINYEDGTIQLEGKQYKLTDNYFSTIDPKNPYQLTEEEKVLYDSFGIQLVSREKVSISRNSDKGGERYPFFNSCFRKI